MNSQIALRRYRSRITCRQPLVNFVPKVSTQRLLELCLQRDEGAWHEFVHRFQPLIAAVVIKTLRRCMNPRSTLIDDLVQETYLKLCSKNFKALRRFECRHENSLAGFLKVVASNVTQDYLRGFLSKKHGSGKAEDQIDETSPKHLVANSSELMERQIVLSQIALCLERESSEANFKRDCTIFWLHYRHGLTAEAISQYPGIGLSVKGVESALFRLTKLLRIKLGGTITKACGKKVSAA